MPRPRRFGSEYAPLGLMDDAKASMARAVEAGPELAIAQFQLGMLRVTSGKVDAAGLRELYAASRSTLRARHLVLFAPRVTICNRL